MKQWYTKIGHNSGIRYTEHLGQTVTNRPFGTFPEGYVSPAIETPSLLDSMPGIGADKYVTGVQGYLDGKYGVQEMFARIGR